jgi:hypothetical protein
MKRSSVASAKVQQYNTPQLIRKLHRRAKVSSNLRYIPHLSSRRSTGEKDTHNCEVASSVQGGDHFQLGKWHFPSWK